MNVSYPFYVIGVSFELTFFAIRLKIASYKRICPDNFIPHNASHPFEKESCITFFEIVPF